jgi:hypothetical protein
MGPRNAYKDMLDKVVSPITCVNMNHQINSNKWQMGSCSLQRRATLLCSRSAQRQTGTAPSGRTAPGRQAPNGPHNAPPEEELGAALVPSSPWWTRCA